MTWVVVDKDRKNQHGQKSWLCKCQCGSEVLIRPNDFLGRKTGVCVHCSAKHRGRRTPAQPGEKTCLRCKELRPKAEFTPSPRHKEGLFPWCRGCKAVYETDRVRNLTPGDRKALNARMKAYRESVAEVRDKYGIRRQVAYMLKFRYGLSVEDVIRIAEGQGGVCAICRAAPTQDKRGGLHVDHDHSTGKVRGLVCESCNQGLGRFRDNIRILEAAIEYLRYPPAESTVVGAEAVA